ncbi:sulfurtransferase [Pullulanibacillus sp. KACC 23026]|uniref:sulfurtransferase n=1 Tax=Pullulanibacillus sp. KACC 23026 TaxID=3028315 RepID=UPI0023B20511|nr:sulfurtransferase [Pullulanibacillus sp. KACC 23026]WEG11962.1 sulfurtransferase [Pullulanibacillus sp. KACC 23026]
MSEFMTVEEACERLSDPKLIIVDCRFDLADKEAGKRAYDEGHLPGAFYMDLEKDLSGSVQIHGGRHPLPDLEILAQKLGTIGIDQTKTVLVYDDQNGSMAARLWWLLKFYGHEDVHVLNGGVSAWLEQGYPLTKELPVPHPVLFKPNPNENWIMDVEDVKNLPAGTLLIDARAPERYRGDVEPLDKKAGHIPGAINWFWANNLEDGKWKSREALRKQFEAFNKKSITLYCGSGVTACANFLGFTEAGLTDLKLYPGSFSDWISYDDHPVATGEGKE